ncbi:MAG: GAF domain-containing protein, partial [Leptolyngbyaceae cyanobacterium CRU_2_3]|nr:GAF domain-containing protein [Leptolyngbyaceae cyanobacterium CRU_2_3]
ATVIQAAREYSAGRPLAPETRARLREILANEMSVRNIEYATLVGTDLKIIVNANKDRTGSKFDPEGLVGNVIANPRQITSNEIVNWEELQTESPPLPTGFTNKDALIRYVVTPVKDPATGTVVGALVSGDIVNNKLSIVEGTLQAFGNGYSAIYQRDANGQFQQATALNLGDSKDLKQAKTGVDLSSPELLQEVETAGGKTITRRVDIAGQTYTVAAKTLNNFKGQPVAVLVRGTSEAALNQQLQQGLLLQLLIALIAITADVALAVVLGRSIVNPIEGLSRTIKKFSQGDRQVRAAVFANDEIGAMARAFNDLADDVATSEAVLRDQNRRQEVFTQRAQLLTEVTLRIRQSYNTEEILNISVEGVRSLLKADRVLMYKFEPDFKSGRITAESVGEGWIKAFGQRIHDPLMSGSIERFKSGKISSIENLAEAKLSRCHCEILEQLEVQANVVVPLIVSDSLIGLLCVHQCSGPRVWEPEEIDMLQQLSTQIGYALTQSILLQQQQSTALQEQKTNYIVSRMRQFLNRQQIFDSVVQDMRESLAVDRAAILFIRLAMAGHICSRISRSQLSSRFRCDHC